MPSLTGSCLCHRVSLTIIDPVPVMDAGLEICRCTDCRQFTGATAGFLLDAETANVSIKGQEDIKSFQSKSDAGNTLTRHWCGNCGSSLYDTTSMREGKRMVIHGGHFRTGSLPKPAVQIYTRSAEKWDQPLEGVPTYDEGSP